MLSRRRFLGVSAFGLVSVSTGLAVPGPQQSAQGPDFAAEAIQQKIRYRPFKDRLLGYPVNMNTPPKEFFDWRTELSEAGIDVFAFNNVGNPYKASPIPYSTHDLERATMESFAELFGFPADDTWGFISHSGTDSNMHGMYMGRTLLKGRTQRVPKAYFTREAHYSVQILSDLLGLESVMVETLADGGMDADDLSVKLAANSDVPILVVATVGTTFKGAVDNVEAIRAAFDGHPSYLHLDAALFGGYLPFTSHADVVGWKNGEANTAGKYDSIAVSCHKFFGFPAPAGLFVTRQRLYDEFNSLFSRIHNPEYIHHVPGTITCSRDAVKPAEFYYFTTPAARRRQAEDATLMLENAAYLLEQLQSHFPELQPVRANRMSNTVFFRNPGGELVSKYSLATMHLDTDGRSEEFAHVIVMPHVSRKVLGEFLTDLETTPTLRP